MFVSCILPSNNHGIVDVDVDVDVPLYLVSCSVKRFVTRECCGGGVLRGGLPWEEEVCGREVDVEWVIVARE